MSRKQKKKSDLREFFLKCVGMSYRLSKKELAQLEETSESELGITATLVLEPENEADPDAIRVMGLDAKKKRYTGSHLGYVRRPANEPLAELIRRGWQVEHCILTNVDSDSGQGDLQIEMKRPS